ncbi:MAG: hypothetical protein OQK76_09445 [Gammaproteobacteria bacterium]|nr:hypothetical protein [Gammaproteobacteria bacterium]MCW8910828.1 hypothetical protein [Gammaproteobacteria bacterium]MCW9006235.1 hypothetical protein [Gammaproteobacteria bacterium]MCW9055848.1 hypothetical protein [Gammaproteobacteria bacterium]
MATPVDSAGTASQVVNIPASEPRPRTEQVESEPVERTPTTESEPTPRRQIPDPDSNTGQNIDTTA